jgi:hypothetical protein
MKLPLSLKSTVLAMTVSMMAACSALANGFEGTLVTPWLDMHYDLFDPSGHFALADSIVSLDAPTFTVTRTPVGDWAYTDSTLFVLHVAPLSAAFGFTVANLSFSFNPGVLTHLDGATDFVSVLDARSASFTTTTKFQAPTSAQLVTALGKDSLSVDNKGEFGHRFQSPVATDSGALSVLNVNYGNPQFFFDGIPWRNVPSDSPWNVTVQHTALGSGHLVASSDPNCIDLTCMNVQRSSADLQELQVTFNVRGIFSPVSAAVPEPPSFMMLALGLALIAELARRRSAAG